MYEPQNHMQSDIAIHMYIIIIILYSYREEAVVKFVPTKLEEWQ